MSSRIFLKLCISNCSATCLHHSSFIYLPISFRLQLPVSTTQPALPVSTICLQPKYVSQPFSTKLSVSTIQSATTCFNHSVSSYLLQPFSLHPPASAIQPAATCLNRSTCSYLSQLSQEATCVNHSACSYLYQPISMQLPASAIQPGATFCLNH
jgi:hypothetical protein